MAEENAPVAAAAAAVGDQLQEKPASETPAEQSKAEGNGKAAAAEEPPKAEMKAVVLTGFGGLKSVKILKKPEPTMGEGEVVIRVKAWWVITVYCRNSINIIVLQSHDAAADSNIWWSNNGSDVLLPKFVRKNRPSITTFIIIIPRAFYHRID